MGSDKKVALVTGGSSGIGLGAVRALRDAGCAVYVFSRRPFEEAGTVHIPCDVSDEEAVTRAVAEIKEQAGRVDILINCAGFGISGAAEFTDAADARRQMEVNFFGTVNVTKAVLPLMRAQGGGRVVNVSSVAAPAAIPFQAFYSASKAAINAYSAALGGEVRPFGITVAAVQPGDIATGFTAARRKSHKGDDLYGGRIARSVAKMERDEQRGGDPDRAGAYLAKIALKKRVKPLYTVGFSYKVICVLLKLLPCGPANRLIWGLYAK